MPAGVRVSVLTVAFGLCPPLSAGCEGDISPAEGLLRAGQAFREPGGADLERCASGPLPGNASAPIFDRLFEGRFPVINHFDHDEPKAFIDRNGRQVDWCGRSRSGQIDGHSGYDFLMPEGTLLLAAADGEVTWAGADGPFRCPFKEGEVRDQLKVDIVHTLPDGRRVVSTYKHLSQLAVGSRQRVRRGQPIALSGDTGCSTVPHLHFETWLLDGTPGGTPVLVDPFGWQGPGPDPWATKPDGAPSIWLWRPGEAPDLSSPAR